jgi:hypothetical protein
MVLGTYKVGSREGLAYELSVAPCTGQECTFQVRLLDGAAELSAIDMDWAKARGTATQEKTDESSGVGDPLGTLSSATAWSTGEDEGSVSTVARTVRLTPELNGLLVSQRAGFDHLKRSYDLYVAIANKLVRSWSFEEGNGPTWSTLEVRDAGKNASQNILLFNGFRYPDDSQPDWLYFTVYSWNPTKNELYSAPAKPVVTALIAGTYDTVSKARAAQAKAACLSAFWVLTSDAFSRLKQGKFVLAAITAHRPLAERKLARLRSCAPHTSVMESPYLQPERN